MQILYYNMDTSPDVPLFQNVIQLRSTPVHVTVVRHRTMVRPSFPSADLQETHNYWAALCGELKYGLWHQSDNKYRKYGSKERKIRPFTRNSQPLKTSWFMSGILILSKYEESTKNARKFWITLPIKELLFTTPTAAEGTDVAHGTSPASFSKHANCRYRQIHLRP
jgi:hypothetical protein